MRKPLTEIYTRLNHLEKENQKLHRTIGLITSDESYFWLLANKDERMDASLDIFDEKRRQFHLERYRLASKYAEGKTFLDMASGTGYGTEMILKDGQASSGYGFDIDQEAVDYATKVHGNDRLTYKTGDVTNIPLEDGSVDLVVSFETIEHITEDAKMLSEFHRVLKSGGTLVCSTPNDWPLSDYHVQRYNYDSFCEVLKVNFEIEKVFNQNSGTEWEYNHGQDAGIVETTDANKGLAECYIAICKKS